MKHSQPVLLFTCPLRHLLKQCPPLPEHTLTLHIHYEPLPLLSLAYAQIKEHPGQKQLLKSIDLAGMDPKTSHLLESAFPNHSTDDVLSVQDLLRIKTKAYSAGPANL